MIYLDIKKIIAENYYQIPQNRYNLLCDDDIQI
ncbi:hypothetical protein ACSSV5_001977 [Psychroflexus sp. MBR-150]|jgi:hypothetical protein